MQAIRSFGVISFKQTAAVADVLERIFTWSRKHEVHVLFHPVLKDIAPPKADVANDKHELLNKSRAVLSIGGDGTFLSVIHLCKFSSIPVIGVNMGDLGFLTDIGPERLEEHLSRLLKGEYALTSRMVLEARLVRDGKELHVFHALNDIFINRCDKPKLISISAWYGDEYITDFQGDGLIVATPSGSTAYSLAAGGPIVEPDVDTLLLTPICPHSLTERPLLLPVHKNIRLKVDAGNCELLLSADGLDTVRVQEGDIVTVAHGGQLNNIVKLSARTHFELLRTKLGWGKNFKARDAHLYDA
ncbi:MAG: NAD(+) kinase [Chitinivibrionales bacterium]|nr:NAD(+) kinase [Chitinivibrionales bacterium]